MDVDEMLDKLGGWGRYQTIMYPILCIPAIFCAINTFSFSWTGYNVEYRCFVDGCDGPNTSYDADFLNFTTPPDDRFTWNRCSTYEKSTTAASTSSSTDHSFPITNAFTTTTTSNQCNADQFNSNITTECNRWLYDDSIMETTVVTEFDLTCDRAWLVPLVPALFMAGKIPAAFINGLIADKLGRKKAVMFNIFVTGITGCLTALAPNYATFLVFRILNNFGATGLYASSFVLVVETVPKSTRTLCGLLINFFYTIGEIILGCLALFILNWKLLTVACFAPIFVLSIYWFIIPESTRWLTVRGNTKEIKNIMLKIAKTNRVANIPTELTKENSKIASEESTECNEITMINMLKHGRLLVRTIIIMLDSFVLQMCFYGFSMNSTNMTGADVHVEFFLAMIAEIPAYIYCILALDRLGRKLTFSSSFLIGGVCTFICAFLPPEYKTVITIFSLVGKFGASAAFATIYIYAAELFPTCIRTAGISLCNAAGGVGAVIAPFVAQLGEKNQSIPLTIFGGFCLAAGIFTLMLPDTTGAKLPNTLEECIKFGQNQPFISAPCLTKRKKSANLE